MTEDLPPKRHPADRPWWHWRYVDVRAWARTRRRGRFVYGSIMGAAFVVLQLGVRQLEIRWGYDPLSVGGIILGGVFFGTFMTLMLWSGTERRYQRALERRAQYDADRRSRDDETGVSAEAPRQSIRSNDA